MLFAVARGLAILGAMSFFCLWQGLFAAMIGLYQRHRHDAVFLTAWDEMAAFLGVALLLCFVNGVVA